MRNHLRRTGIIPLLLAIVLFSRVAQAQQHTPLSDEQIRARVVHQLEENEIFGVTISVQDGVVTLAGEVPSLWVKERAVSEALGMNDVDSVVSELMISQGESDRAIAEEVARRVRRYVFYTIYDDIEIRVDQGSITLTGAVTLPYKAHEIADLAARVRGVQEVRNEIRVLPVSSFDDQLRASIAGRIYRDPLFWNYAIQVNPPIHILVENGRVTLTGVVTSEVERRKAESVARSTFGVFSVENKLRLERD